jgi:hypothetical protein
MGLACTSSAAERRWPAQVLSLEGAVHTLDQVTEALPSFAHRQTVLTYQSRCGVSPLKSIIERLFEQGAPMNTGAPGTGGRLDETPGFLDGARAWWRRAMLLPWLLSVVIALSTAAALFIVLDQVQEPWVKWLITPLVSLSTVTALLHRRGRVILARAVKYVAPDGSSGPSIDEETGRKALARVVGALIKEALGGRRLLLDSGSSERPDIALLLVDWDIAQDARRTRRELEVFGRALPLHRQVTLVATVRDRTSLGAVAELKDLPADGFPFLLVKDQQAVTVNPFEDEEVVSRHDGSVRRVQDVRDDLDAPGLLRYGALTMILSSEALLCDPMLLVDDAAPGRARKDATVTPWHMKWLMARLDERSSLTRGLQDPDDLEDDEAVHKDPTARARLVQQLWSGHEADVTPDGPGLLRARHRGTRYDALFASDASRRRWTATRPRWVQEDHLDPLRLERLRVLHASLLIEAAVDHAGDQQWDRGLSELASAARKLAEPGGNRDQVEALVQAVRVRAGESEPSAHMLRLAGLWLARAAGLEPIDLEDPAYRRPPWELMESDDLCARLLGVTLTWWTAGAVAEHDEERAKEREQVWEALHALDEAILGGALRRAGWIPEARPSIEGTDDLIARIDHLWPFLAVAESWEANWSGWGGDAAAWLALLARTAQAERSPDERARFSGWACGHQSVWGRLSEGITVAQLVGLHRWKSEHGEELGRSPGGLIKLDQPPHSGSLTAHLFTLPNETLQEALVRFRLAFVDDGVVEDLVERQSVAGEVDV